MSTQTARRRLAGAPISWGVCEVPGWGAMMAPDRVFSEMASLGLEATELGPLDAYLPFDAAGIREGLDRHGVRLLGGFVPLVLHEPDATAALQEGRRVARTMAAAGAETFVLAMVGDADWSVPEHLDDDAWAVLARNVDALGAVVADEGLVLAVHPHQGTLVERAADVECLLEATTVGWCLDPGHLVIGGHDPVDFVRRHADRIVHVHLKDVDAAVVARLTAGELTLLQAVRQGLFRPLGRGDARIGEILAELDEHGYGGWMVLEQDTAIVGEEPPAGAGPIDDVRASLEFLATEAPGKGRLPR